MNRFYQLLAASLLAAFWAELPGGTLWAAEPIEEPPITSFDRDHWAYRPIERPRIPRTERVDWAETDIDQFILAALEKRSLHPAPRADRATLIRRVFMDLIGLPPSPEQLERLLADSHPDAYRRLVDALLASPEYGQRWGQYWLDLARFADTDGFEHDKVRPTAWQYRDWVIEAWNSDLPYDRFVQWQIAGDAIAPENPEASIATAFCLSGPDMPDINSQDERRHVLLNEITSTVGAVFFSLQVGCAQCHDHKYDAISQADFYRLRAFFEPAIELKNNRSVTVLASHSATPTSHLMIRGDWRRPGAAVEAAFPRIANPNEDSADDEDPAQRRAKLAQWLTNRDHPLTARSIVNRVWQHHFGAGLSTTPSDFGVMSDEPSHPELLDYLADQLMREGWSLKKLHRQILLSAVYQTRSTRPQDPSSAQHWNDSLQADRSNRWLSRFPRQRLDAETIRDCLFAVSDSLNHEVGGPGVSPPLPEEMIKTLKRGQWTTSSREADHYRRSVYIFARRNLRYPFFATFDRPAAEASCPQRARSTTAVQSLSLMNAELSFDAAQRLADVVERRTEIPQDQIRELFRRCYSRPPTPTEITQCETFLCSQRELIAAESEDPRPASTALVDLCRALLNANEFVYVD